MSPIDAFAYFQLNACYEAARRTARVLLNDVGQREATHSILRPGPTSDTIVCTNTEHAAPITIPLPSLPLPPSQSQGNDSAGVHGSNGQARAHDMRADHVSDSTRTCTNSRTNRKLKSISQVLQVVQEHGNPAPGRGQATRPASRAHTVVVVTATDSVPLLRLREPAASPAEPPAPATAAAPTASRATTALLPDCAAFLRRLLALPAGAARPGGRDAVLAIVVRGLEGRPQRQDGVPGDGIAAEVAEATAASAGEGVAEALQQRLVAATFRHQAQLLHLHTTDANSNL